MPRLMQQQSAAASAPTNLTAAALPQAAIAASPPTLAEASNPTDAGSQVGFAAQIIIAVGVIPLELIIVAIVLGVHRLVYCRSSRSPPIRVDRAHSAQDPLPYLQLKAELEDELNRKHGEGELFQIAETGSLDLPLQGTLGIHEMSGVNQLTYRLDQCQSKPKPLHVEAATDHKDRYSDMNRSA